MYNFETKLGGLQSQEINSDAFELRTLH